MVTLGIGWKIWFYLQNSKLFFHILSWNIYGQRQALQLISNKCQTGYTNILWFLPRSEFLDIHQCKKIKRDIFSNCSIYFKLVSFVSLRHASSLSIATILKYLSSKYIYIFLASVQLSSPYTQHMCL